MTPDFVVNNVLVKDIDSSFTFRFDIRVPAACDVSDEDRPTFKKHVHVFRKAIRNALEELWGVAYDGSSVPDSCVTHYKVQGGDPGLLHHEQIEVDLS